MDWSADGLGSEMRDFFLGNSRIRPTLLDQCERLPHMACHKHIRVMCIRFLS
jgi:hypothetical protein